MELETEPEGGGPRASSPWLWRWLTAFWRWLWLPVDFWRAMEVIGLWTAAVVGLLAIYYSTRDAGEQVKTMRDSIADDERSVGRNAAGRQTLGRPYRSSLVSKDRNEPLRVTLSYRNFGRQPATFVRNTNRVMARAMEPWNRIEDSSWWKDPKWPRSCGHLSQP